MKAMSELASIALMVYVVILLSGWSSRLKSMFVEDEPWRESLRPDTDEEREDRSER